MRGKVHPPPQNPIGLYGLLMLPQFRPNYMVAGDLHIHPTRLSEYARGKKHIPDSVLIRICSLLDCTPDEVLRPFELVELYA